MWVKEIERKEKAYDGPESWIKVNQIDGSETQGRKVMTSYITTVAAANAISALSISVSFILPISGEGCLAFQGKRYSRQLELVFLALSQNEWIGMFKWWLGMSSNRPWVLYNRHKAE